MIFRRIMTGLAASVVIVFSTGFLCTLWHINTMEVQLDIMGDKDGLKYQGIRYAAEVHMDEGIFERLVLYRCE